MVLKWLPFLLFVSSVANIIYLAVISVFPASWGLNLLAVIGLRLACLIVTGVVFRRALPYFSAMPQKAQWLMLVPYALIFLVRFPLIYPTYDDLAAHLVWGDYANQLWQIRGFMPMNFLNYFYLPLDMNYTPFLYVIGIRLTIWLFYVLTSFWLFSLYVRFCELVKTGPQKALITVLFMILPFIPHLLGVIGTLMGDYGSLVFCLEALYLFLNKDKNKTFAVLMSVTAVLMKQSNSIFIAPLLLYFFWKERKNIQWRWPILYACVASLFFIRLYLETGNPLSGLFNGIFHSALYAPVSFRQTNFGPENFWQFLLWPIIGQFTARYAEGIVSAAAQVFFAPIPIIGYCVSIWLLIKQRSIKYGLIVITYLLWSYLVGYARYYVALNLMALLMLIFELKSFPLNWWKKLASYKWLILGVIFLASLSSLKTDFSWRPNPSLVTRAANDYYLKEYTAGLRLVGRDTVTELATQYQSLFAPYQAVITVYRGPVTFISYMGYLNNLPVYDAVTPAQYTTILSDPKIAEGIKNRLKESFSYQRVILLAEKPFDQTVATLKIYQDFNCERLGPATKDAFLQRESYFKETIVFSCTQP